MVYVTEPLGGALADIVGYLRRTTGIDHWTGAVGSGICATGHEYFEAPAIAVLACDLPAGEFRMLASTDTVGAIDTAALGPWSAAHGPPLGIIHCDPRNPAVTDIVPALAAATGGFLVGGLTSAAVPDVEVADGATHGGVSGVLLGSATAMATGLTQGCSPVGPLREVTAMREHVIAGLDGRDPVAAFKDDIGELLAREPSRIAGYIHAAVPVAGSDTGDYMVRNLVGVDEAQGLLAIAAPLAEGDRVMFVRRDPAAAVEDLHRMLGDVRDRVGGTPRAGLYHSCIARCPHQFGPGAVELTAIREVLGEFPLVGFFGNGEISNDRLYTYTGVLTVFV